MAESKYYGIYQGIVTSIKDPEMRGRIKVKIPNVLGADTESAWCDPCISVAYDGGGDFFIPPIDETVWIMFIEGDVNRPVWLGSWWSKSKSTLGDSYTDINKVRIINYADCSITMKDGIISISTSNGNLQIKDGKVSIKGDLDVDGNVSAHNIQEI